MAVIHAAARLNFYGNGALSVRAARNRVYEEIHKLKTFPADNLVDGLIAGVYRTERRRGHNLPLLPVGTIKLNRGRSRNGIAHVDDESVQLIAFGHADRFLMRQSLQIAVGYAFLPVCQLFEFVEYIGQRLV